MAEQFRGFASQVVSQFSSRYSPVVAELLRLQVQDSAHFNPHDKPFHEKAIKALLRKLKREKNRGNQVNKLLKVVQNKGTGGPEIGCIVIPRSLDGRMQVSNKKVQPHVLYCSIWRWPDVRNQHELRNIPDCEYSHHLRRDLICVNPYHYERVRPQPLPPVLVPRLPPNSIPERFINFDSLAKDDFNNQEWVVADNFNLESITGSRTLQSPTGYGALSECSEMSEPPSPLSPGLPPLSPLSASGSSIGSPDSSTQSPPSSIASSIGDNPRPGVIRANADFISRLGNLDIINEQQQQHQQPPPVIHDQPHVKLEPEDDEYPASSSPGSLEAPSEIKSEPYEEQDALGALEQHDQPMRTEVPYIEDAKSWCTISYYEENKRYGELFQGIYNHLRIDGSSGPSDGSRFCLGKIANPNRKPDVHMVRMKLGNGIDLIYEMGIVKLENLSDHMIFIQSADMNDRLNLGPKTVIKIPSGHGWNIFDNQSFAERLGRKVEEGFEEVYGLLQMCTVRVSFIKGWGSDYRRAHVTNTPCWCEIHLNGPLQWLDRVLREMNGPNKKMTSFS